MMRSVLLAATAALVAAGFSGPGGSGSGAPATTRTPLPSSPTHLQDVLAHSVPPVSSATYHVTDTMVISIGSATRRAELTAVATATLSMSFRSDPAGVRVNAEVVDFGGSVGSPAMGTQSLDKDDARGSMIFVVGTTGAVEPVARPELSPDAGQFSFFNQLPYDLFPGLPGRVAGPGESWSDTAVWYSSAGGMETTQTMARTYTLVGDTVVNGRSLLAISLSAEVAISGSGSQGGLATSQNIAGSLTGHLLWDAEAGLLHMAQLMRRHEGQSTMEGRPPGSVSLAGPQRISRKK